MADLTIEERKNMIDETNNWIHENNMLGIRICSLSSVVRRIGLFDMVFASRENRQLYNTIKENFNSMKATYQTTQHKIEVNEKILGIKDRKKKMKLTKNKTL